MAPVIPEEDFYGGFAPRFGAVYRFNDKTVLRSGWGIFYMQAFYPGWGGGISQDGFSTTPSFNTSLGGIQPAFFLEQGLPAELRAAAAHPVRLQERTGPVVSPDRRQQAALLAPVEHHGGPRARTRCLLSVAYVGSAGRRLPSSIEPLNAIDPSYLSMGDSALRRVHAWHDQPARRAAAVCRMG